MTFTVTMVYADGNPIDVESGIVDAADACRLYDELRAKHPGTPPAILIGIDDDPEAGWFDSGSLEELLGDEELLCG